jgi:hypothetical protein
LTAASNSARVNEPPVPISVSWTPAFAPLPPVSCQTAWLPRETMTSSPGEVSVRRTTWLAIVPREPERGFLAQQAGDALLEAVDRRVVAELVVADLGLGHRGAHPGRRPGDGVGTEIDRCHQASRPDGRIRGRC